MAKLTALFFTVLLLCSIMANAARPEPASHKHSLTQTQREGGAVAAVDENCEGAGEEECLMRRTLAAHLDYIYTQKQKP